MSAGVVVALVVGIVVGLVLGALARNVFMVTWGAWLLFWDEVRYHGRRSLQALGVLAIAGMVVALVIHFT